MSVSGKVTRIRPGDPRPNPVLDYLEGGPEPKDLQNTVVTAPSAPVDKEVQEPADTDKSVPVDKDLHGNIAKEINTRVTQESQVLVDSYVQANAGTEPQPPENQEDPAGYVFTIPKVEADDPDYSATNRKAAKQVALKRVKARMGQGRGSVVGQVKKATFDLPADLHRRLKWAAFDHDVDMVDIVIEALETHLVVLNKR